MISIFSISPIFMGSNLPVGRMDARSASIFFARMTSSFRFMVSFWVVPTEPHSATTPCVPMQVANVRFMHGRCRAGDTGAGETCGI